MLKLENIKKDYVSGDLVVQALKGVSLDFRKNEFVAVLGPSGCGKTTMLNIIGGLDRYTSGDLSIDSRSTKNFKDSDWDSYRNHTIGFVFQNYNLISHQTVLENVAIALTLSGISPFERKQRAMEALTSMGISDQAYKKPNQLSGGQMQRVAIARALVNNPKIILADEPTGALDSATSDQIMKILTEVAKDRLVIMVTHNGDIAQEYANRIIRLKDGEVIQDTNPITEAKSASRTAAADKSLQLTNTVKKSKKEKTSMSYFTALKLSFKNLLTKKTRTILTAIAGSIGIIGVALVLAISSGMNAFIADMQRETLSSLPIEIRQATWVSKSESSGMMNNNYTFPTGDNIYKTEKTSDPHWNNFSNPDFITYINTQIKPLTLDQNKVCYSYETIMNALYKNNDGTYTRIGSSNARVENIDPRKPKKELYELPDESLISKLSDTLASLADTETGAAKKAAYVAEEAIPLTLIIDQNNCLEDWQIEMLTGISESHEDFGKNIKFSDFLGQELKLVHNKDIISEETGKLQFNTSNFGAAYTAGRTMYIDRIMRGKQDSSSMIVSGSSLAYPADLRERLTKGDLTSFATLPAYQATMVSMNDTEALITYTENVFSQQVDGLTAYLNGSLFTEANLGDKRAEVIFKAFAIDQNPNGVNIYAKDFKSKEKIKTLLSDWNKNPSNAINQIKFNDMADIITGVIKSIVDVISIVLTAFAAVSLVVSTIMIGIITYVSVVERTKEIGILRSIGARKKDISRVFNAETLIVGFTAGLIGVIMTYLFSIPINLIVGSLAGVSTIAALPLITGGLLVVLSMGLTLVGGFIPSRIAAKKDPVIALRTE